MALLNSPTERERHQTREESGGGKNKTPSQRKKDIGKGKDRGNRANRAQPKNH